MIFDRLDGLALLADALAEGGAVGRVRDYIRVFERAFRSGPAACVPLLTAFLQSDPNHLDYAESEVQDWLLRVRSETMHADRRESYARGPDVEPYVRRMEYAAYDVLFNKRNWRQPDVERRDGVTLRAGTDRNGEVILFDLATTITASWLDPFGVFPVDFDSTLGEIPAPWISSMPGYTGDEAEKYSTQIPFRYPDIGTRRV